MPAFNDGFLDLPQRPGKPRTEGLTHVIDKGLNLRDIEGLFDTAGDYVDIVKLGWGTSYVTRNLEKKIALYRYFETPIGPRSGYIADAGVFSKSVTFDPWTKLNFVISSGM